MEEVYKVFPARAGMIPGDGAGVPATTCIPRESGDDPWNAVKVYNVTKYSPRERG